MAELIPIKIPLLNPNEPEALLASLAVNEGERVKQGQTIAVIETTKSTGEVVTEQDGFLVGLRFDEGDTLQAGQVLAYLGDSPQASDPSLIPWKKAPSAEDVTPEVGGLRITAPARKLALARGLSLDSLPQDTLITTERVKTLLERSAPVRSDQIPNNEKRLLIYGAGGHGRSLAALIRKNDDYQLVGFVDDGYPACETMAGLPLLGGREALAEQAERGVRMAVNGVGGIGDLQTRLSVYDLLAQEGFYIPKMIHPTSFIEANAVLGDGVQVFPFAYVGTDVKVGFGCIINTGTIVSHDCVLADYVNLSPGATLAGGVTLGEGALVGMRATINLGVHVGIEARIGNGATVKTDVPDGGVVPAGTIWPPRR